MRPSQARFVTTCQQLLALAVVCAALTPAAAVVSLDVVRDAPAGADPGRQAPVVALSAYAREEHRSSVLPAGPVEAQVDEYPLTAATGRQTSTAGESSPSRAPLGVVTRRVGNAGTVLVSRPERVQGYGSVGITWDQGATPPGADLAFSARLLTDGTWSSWIDIPYDPEHAPDPGTAEARHARPGTDILLVGKVDRVQVRSTSTASQPAGMSLAVVDPGHPEATEKAPAAFQATSDGVVANTGASTTAQRSTTGAKTRVTPEPTIYSRAQWGANERLRDRSSLHYYEVHAGFVHHTVNANDYTRREVPGIIRSIYAYHVQSRGWSDIGYNFLVDKFGRVWEGRYGGVDRPVVGAHTLYYNEYSFAMSAIGNFETTRPRDVMLQAYGSLFAWKLSLHGVDAGSTDQLVGSTHFQAINGHRDAASTACPGRHLYAKLPTIREYAEADQRSWSGRDLQSDVAAAPYPDLVVRRASDGKAFIIPTGGLLGFDKTRVTPDVWLGRDLVIGSPDLTGDGIGDLVSRNAETGRAVVRPGSDTGFGTGIRATDALAGRDLVAAAGDLNGDGDNDLVARNKDSGLANVYLGGGDGSLTRRATDVDLGSYDLLAGAGDLDGDGNADLVARDRSGHLWLLPGTGTRNLGDPVAVPGDGWGRYDSITGLADYTHDGNADLLVRVRGGAAYVLGGRGDGTFTRRHGPYDRLTTGGRLFGVGNVMGTGAPDVVARRGDDLLTFQNNGHRDLGTPIATGLDVSSANRLLNVGDWDRDGHNDIVTRRASDGDLFVRLGDGRGGFSDGVKIGEGFGKVRLLAAVGDMTGDGFPDLMGQPRGGSMKIYPGRGLHQMGVGYAAHSPIKAGRQIGLGRWDKDGAPDSLFRQGDQLVYFRGNGPGGLMTPHAVSGDVRRYDWMVGVSDLTGAGRSDLLVRTRAGDLYALRSTPKGFGAPRFLGGGMDRYDLVG